MRRALLLGAISALLTWPLRRRIVSDIQDAARSWRQTPATMAGKVGLSFAAGQGIFWQAGYDQLGLFMNPKFQIGFGQRVADELYARLPHTPQMAWGVKLVEVLADAGKIPIEGALYRRYGIVPDGVAALVTQPLWSALETAEKITGAFVHPERVRQPEQVKLSLGCIYGSLFRYLLAGLFLLVGKSINAPEKSGASSCRGIEKSAENGYNPRLRNG